MTSDQPHPLYTFAYSPLRQPWRPHGPGAELHPQEGPHHPPDLPLHPLADQLPRGHHLRLRTGVCVYVYVYVCARIYVRGSMLCSINNTSCGRCVPHRTCTWLNVRASLSPGPALPDPLRRDAGVCVCMCVSCGHRYTLSLYGSHDKHSLIVFVRS
jgi:hypothetical protein